jgi:hypothetical protein
MTVARKGDRVRVEFTGVVTYQDNFVTSVGMADGTNVTVATDGVPLAVLGPEVLPGDVWLPGSGYLPFIAVGTSDDAGDARLYPVASATALPRAGYSQDEFFDRYRMATLINRRTEYDPD